MKDRASYLVGSNNGEIVSSVSGAWSFWHSRPIRIQMVSYSGGDMAILPSDALECP